MGMAGGIMQLGSMVQGGVGAFGVAKSNKQTLNYQAALDDINADNAELAAQQELAKGQYDTFAVTRRAGQIKSAQRASMAANGIDLGVGSAAEVLTSTDIQKQEDMNVIEQNALRAAWGQRVNATNLRNEANMKRTGSASINPLLSAHDTMLGSAGGVAQSWYAMNKSSQGVK